MSNGLAYYAWDAAVIRVVVGTIVIEGLGKIDDLAVEATAADNVASPTTNGFLVVHLVDRQRPEVRGSAPLRVDLVQNRRRYAHRNVIVVQHGTEAVIEFVTATSFYIPSLIQKLLAAPCWNGESAPALEGKMVRAPPVMRHISARIPIAPVVAFGYQRGAICVSI